MDYVREVCALVDYEGQVYMLVDCVGQVSGCGLCKRSMRASG